MVVLPAQHEPLRMSPLYRPRKETRIPCGGTRHIDSDHILRNFRTITDFTERQLDRAMLSSYRYAASLRRRFVNGRMSGVYELPSMRSLMEGESTTAYLWLRGGAELTDISDQIGIERPGYEPVHLDVQLRSGLLFIRSVDVIGDVTFTAFNEVKIMEGSFIMQPKGEGSDLWLQRWHNDRMLRTLYDDPEVQILKSGFTLTTWALVDLDNGLMKGFLRPEQKVFGKGWGEVEIRVAKNDNVITATWRSRENIRQLAPRLQTYFQSTRPLAIARPGSIVRAALL